MRVGRGIVERFVQPLLVGIALPVLLFGLGPSWAKQLHTQATTDMAESFDEAEAWIVKNIPPGTPILVDNVLWMELVARGYPAAETVWYYKLDLDSQVAAQYPRGWREFDYLISTPVLRATAQDLADVRQALENSVVVNTFLPSHVEGDGVKIEIRAITGEPHRTFLD